VNVTIVIACRKSGFLTKRLDMIIDPIICQLLWQSSLWLVSDVFSATLFTPSVVVGIYSLACCSHSSS